MTDVIQKKEKLVIMTDDKYDNTFVVFSSSRRFYVVLSLKSGFIINRGSYELIVSITT